MGNLYILRTDFFFKISVGMQFSFSKALDEL